MGIWQSKPLKNHPEQWENRSISTALRDLMGNSWWFNQQRRWFRPTNMVDMADFLVWWRTRFTTRRNDSLDPSRTLDRVVGSEHHNLTWLYFKHLQTARTLKMPTQILSLNLILDTFDKALPSCKKRGVVVWKASCTIYLKLLRGPLQSGWTSSCSPLSTDQKERGDSG